MNRAFGLSDEKRQKLSNSLRSNIKFCTFDNRPCEKTLSFGILAICIMFNSNASQVIKTKTSGSLYGLLVYLKNLTSQNKYPTFYTSGLKVFVTNTSFLTQ